MNNTFVVTLNETKYNHKILKKASFSSSHLQLIIYNLYYVGKRKIITILKIFEILKFDVEFI